MESGKDLAGNNLNRAIEFCAGAVVTPEARPIEPQLGKFRKKVAAGAEFFLTQIVDDLNNFRDFRQYTCGLKVRTLAGIGLLASAGIARHMNKNAPGIFVSDELIDELAGVEI